MSVGVLVHDVPGPVAAAVDAEAAKDGVSVNTVIVRVLARRYGYEGDLLTYPYHGASRTDSRLVRLPPELREAIRAHSRALNVTQRGLILMALADHYGLDAVSPQRRHQPALSPDEVAQVRARHQAGESMRSLATAFGVHRDTIHRAVATERTA